MEESVELARLAVEDGTEAVVATSHVRHDFLTDVRDLPERIRDVRERLATECVPLRVVCGAELGHEMVGRLTQADLDSVAVGPPGARWLLVETPFEGIDDDLHDAADELRDRGFGVVLAHPERSAGVLADGGSALHREIMRGTVLQVNAASLTGGHGPAPLTAGIRLLAAGAVEVMGSDAHSRVRGPALERGVHAALRHGVPEAVARRAADFAPMRLLSRGLAQTAAAAV
jgi:protein-tyrosine phosphatase